MLKCKRCKGRVFVDRVFTSHDHLETFCIRCGERKIYHPPSKFSNEIQLIHQNELKAAYLWNGK